MKNKLGGCKFFVLSCNCLFSSVHSKCIYSFFDSARPSLSRTAKVLSASILWLLRLFYLVLNTVASSTFSFPVSQLFTLVSQTTRRRKKINPCLGIVNKTKKRKLRQFGHAWRKEETFIFNPIPGDFSGYKPSVNI